jgi:hypothetical protein
MTKVAYVTFKRTVYLYDVGNLNEDEIKEKAVEVWNEEMELGDILMDEEHIIKVEVEEE